MATAASDAPAGQARCSACGGQTAYWTKVLTALMTPQGTRTALSSHALGTSPQQAFEMTRAASADSRRAVAGTNPWSYGTSTSDTIV